MGQSIFLSIITVNYNSGLNLKKTLSALETYANHDGVELILIDGKSTDCSLRDAEECKSFITKYISEEDNGIFDAMNKGIKYSRGNWLWFINSGDAPRTTPRETAELIDRAEQAKANFIFSDLSVGDNIIRQQLNLKTLLIAMINHQNAIYHKDLLKDGYDVSFRYCADYFHLLNSLKVISTYKATVALCNYDVDGVSSLLSRKRRVSLWLERLKAQRKAKIGFPLKLLFILVSLLAIILKIINPRIGSKMSSAHY